MENQHKLIDGYRELTQEEIGTMNAIKRLAKEVGALCDGLATLENSDPRWIAIGKADLQKGFMALVRAIARPESF